LYHEGKIEEVKRLYEKITRYLFAISSVIILLIFLFWQPILSLYGPEYLKAKNVLLYRGLGQLVNASVGSVWYIVLMTGHQKIRLISILASAIINIVLNYLLIPTMGIDGAALASMVSTIFINIIGFFVVKHILKSKVYYFV
jgi:O-antigen/teichoic acid export membrane protein